MDAEKRTVLAISAHCDDEVLGCGGTLLKHHEQGDATHILIMTDGAGDVRGYKNDRRPRKFSEFKAEFEAMAAAPAWKNAHKAAELLGAGSLQIRDLPDSRFDSIDILDMAHLVEEAIDRVRPDIVYTHFVGELNVDHARTAQAVITACRPKPGHPVKELYFWENPSSVEWACPVTFQPQMFVSIDFEKKHDVIYAAYESEMRDFPHPRCGHALGSMSRYRGAQSGLMAAESFMVGRIIA